MSEKTNTQEETSGTEEQEYTDAQIKEMRKKMLAYYKEEIVFLKVQEQYERLIADVEEHKVRKFVAMARGAQMYAQAEAAEREHAQAQQEPEAEPRPKRKLKTEADV